MMGLPPWWILNNVKPAGPDKDMGGWTAISFSVDQQAEFGIDEDGKVLDQAKFDGAIRARSAPELTVEEPARIAELIPEKLYKIVVKGGSAGLEVNADSLAISGAAPNNWRIRRSPNGWLRLCVLGEPGQHLQCLDLSNPGQEPTMNAEADVSGQYWKLAPVIGCKELEGGAMARSIVGYKLSAMWTGEARVLTAGAQVLLQADEEGPSQIWEILDEAGQLWTSEAAAPALPELEEPQIIACDFGQAR